MQIVLRSVPNPPVPIQQVIPPGPGGPGHRFVFSEDFDLVSIDGRAAQNQRAVSHSGFVTTVRIARAGDNLYPPGNYLMQYEGTYRFNAVPASAGQPSTSLAAGQITARGLLYTDPTTTPIPPIKFAITGGFLPLGTWRDHGGEPNPQQQVARYSVVVPLVHKSFCAEGGSVPKHEHQPR
jgi:hypothetical protein